VDVMPPTRLSLAKGYSPIQTSCVDEFFSTQDRLTSD
jgi:hypothetical protein